MPETNQQPPATEKVVFEFQHTDEQGNPIINPRTGKPDFTNFTGANDREVLEKMKDSYLNVRRALNRAQNHKPVPKAPEPQRKELSAEEERQAAADLQDPSKARAAVRKLTGVDDIEARQKAADDAKFTADAKAAAYQFMSRHINDYYPCQANSVELSRYITENDLDPRSADNYEVAFNAVQHLLAPRPAPAAPAAPATPKIDEEPPAPPAPPRRASGGIAPGEFSGERPRARKTNAVTKESIREMCKTAEGRAEYRKRMKNPEFADQVSALGMRPLGNF